MTISHAPCKPQFLGYNQITIKINRSLGDRQTCFNDKENGKKDHQKTILLLHIHGPFHYFYAMMFWNLYQLILMVV